MLTSNQRDILAGILTYKELELIYKESERVSIAKVLDIFEERRKVVNEVCERLGKEQEDETSSN